jgi:hypothetical protein
VYHSPIRYTVANPLVDKGASAVAEMLSHGRSRPPGALTVAELLDRIHPDPEPQIPVEHASPISVDTLLRREGRTPLRGPGSPTSAVGDPRIHRTAVAAGALLATGAVVGVAVFTDASGGTDPLGAPDGAPPGRGQQDRPADGLLSNGDRATIVDAAARSGSLDPGVAAASDLAGLALAPGPAARNSAAAGAPATGRVSENRSSAGMSSRPSNPVTSGGSTSGARSGANVSDDAESASDEAGTRSDDAGSASEDTERDSSDKAEVGDALTAAGGAGRSGAAVASSAVKSATEAATEAAAQAVSDVDDTAAHVLDGTSDLVRGVTDSVGNLDDETRKIPTDSRADPDSPVSNDDDESEAKRDSSDGSALSSLNTLDKPVEKAGTKAAELIGATSRND